MVKNTNKGLACILITEQRLTSQVVMFHCCTYSVLTHANFNLSHVRDDDDDDVDEDDDERWL